VVVGIDDSSSLSLLPELISVAPEARLVVLTRVDRDSVHHKVVEMGAHAIVMKDQSPEHLIGAIEKVHQGEYWLSRAMIANLLKFIRSPKEASPEEQMISALSEREFEVITLLGDGMTNQDIAEKLHISVSTVRHHLTSVYRKLNVRDRLELLIFAYRHGLIELPD
jgi:DNA-binding NarL/FixJ family response regulator